ncbi:excisionase [Aliivibrio fischeri]|nr:excisionase [Aliivibrio fischeri]MUK70191.1 excisionase [Aliivibrio fischeri]MUK72725.1 excisionase [Aliivibrio fischeri]MUK91663.1 excisionase [Aliivibrio fischeri]MUL20107.1 excisionase [Aliivibrio fischeri]
MDQSTIIIAIAAPYVTTERYAEISGIKPGTIERKISAKKFPVLPKEGSRELNLINLALLTKHALEAKF